MSKASKWLMSKEGHVGGSCHFSSVSPVHKHFYNNSAIWSEISWVVGRSGVKMGGKNSSFYSSRSGSSSVTYWITNTAQQPAATESFFPLIAIGCDCCGVFKCSYFCQIIANMGRHNSHLFDRFFSVCLVCLRLKTLLMDGSVSYITTSSPSVCEWAHSVFIM